jgi:DNA-binding NarL/FixJ family response regulator
MTRILLVDDHVLVRSGVKRALAEVADIRATFGEAGNAEEALARLHEDDWDLAVLDLSLAGSSGFDLLKRMKQMRPDLPVLILSMHAEDQYAQHALRAGAAGYLAKGSASAELVRAIRGLVKRSARGPATRRG